MKLIVRNDRMRFFELVCEEYQGYEVFCLAREKFGNDWETYTVLEGDRIIENVINPMAIDWDNPQTLQ